MRAISTEHVSYLVVKARTMLLDLSAQVILGLRSGPMRSGESSMVSGEGREAPRAYQLSKDEDRQSFALLHIYLMN